MQQNARTDKIFNGLIPLTKFNEFYSYPTVKTIRQYQFQNLNGFNEKVVVVINKRQYLNISEFEKWLDTFRKREVKA